MKHQPVQKIHITISSDLKIKMNFYILFLFIVSSISIYGQKTTIEVNNLDDISDMFDEVLVKDKDTVKDDVKKGNFVPFPIPITDENLGYGGVIGVAYMRRNTKSRRENTPKNITGIAGGGTNTGSWLATIFHSRTFIDDKIRYDGVLGYADIYLDFYVLENIDLVSFPINTNISFWGTQHQVLFRLGNSKFFIGPQYRFLDINGGVKLEIGRPEHEGLEIYKSFKERISALALLGNFDNRDQTISPVKGYYTGFVFRRIADWLGSTRNYSQGDIFAYAYYRLSSNMYTILHFDHQFTGDNAPFYTKPYIGLRGIPAMRYQGNHVTTAEIQWRVDVIKNFSLVAFTGVGEAYNEFNQFESSKLVYNYGTGIRYTLKKVDNLRVGVDFGWGSDNNFGWVISFGTAL
jgi:hypothetical protein